MADRLSVDEEGLLLAQLEASAVAEAARYAVDVDRLVRLDRLATRSGHTERGIELELAGTLRIGQQAAALRLADARRLAGCLPLTLQALSTGLLLVPQAELVLEETRHCTEEVAAEVERRVVGGDPELLAGWTARRLRSRLRAAVLAAEAALDQAQTVERERSARAARRVTVRPEPDGMASLWALLPAEQARTFTLGLDELTARQREADRAAGIERTADQRRADLIALLPLLALHALDGTTPPPDGGHPAVVVQVHVPVATALGLSDEPGELTGYGPISAGTVRLLLPDARLRRVLVDAETGRPLHVAERTTAPASRRAAGSGRRGGVVLTSGVPTAGSAAVASTSPAGAAPAGTGSLSTGPVSTGPVSTGPVSTGSTSTEPVSSPASASPLSAGTRVERALREALLDMLDDWPFLLDETPEPQYRPSRPLTRLVQVRDQHCCAPGCSRGTRPADLDHRVPWPLGPTSAANLAPLSRRCHRAKTTSWSLDRDRDGSHTWTSPTGRRYSVPPPWRPPPVPRSRRPVVAVVEAEPPQWPVAEGDLTEQLDKAGPALAAAGASPAGPPRLAPEPPPF